jgi:hypothetical protein
MFEMEEHILIIYVSGSYEDDKGFLPLWEGESCLKSEPDLQKFSDAKHIYFCLDFKCR